MKLKRISFKVISMVMVFTILFGVSAQTISAATEWIDSHSEENETIEASAEEITEE